MSMIVKQTNPVDFNQDIFYEGNLVVSKRHGGVFLVTLVAQGYDDSSEGTFWGIDLSTGSSGGNYLKSLFKQFVGTITLEGKF